MGLGISFAGRRMARTRATSELSRLLLTSASALAMVLAAPSVARAADSTIAFPTTSTYSSDITVLSGDTTTLQTDGGATTTLTGVISETGNLNFTGPGAFDLTSLPSSTWNGITTLNGGVTVTISNASQLSGSQVNLGDSTSGATLSLASGLDYTHALTLGTGGTNTVTGNGTLSGKITGSGGLTFAGNGSLISIPSTSINNDYAGATTIGAGVTVVLQASEGFGTNRSVTLDGGTLEATVLDKDIVLTADSTINHVGNGDASYYGSITGNHDLSIIRTGQYYTVYLNSAVSLGTLTIADGVNVRASGAASVTGLLTVSGIGAFIDNGMPSGLQIGGLAGDGQIMVDKTLIINDAGTGAVFSGSLSGNLLSTAGLTIAGGTQEFADAQFYLGGPIEVDNGATMLLSGVANLNALGGSESKTIIQTGGTLQLADNAQVTLANLEGGGQLVLGTGNTLRLMIWSGVHEFSGAISGPSGDWLYIDNSMTFSGASTYAGITYVTNGQTLTLAGAGSLGGVVDLPPEFSPSIPVATLDISGVTTGGSVGGLQDGGTVILGSKTLTLTNAVSDISNTDTWFSGNFSGTGNVTLTGGTQILSGDSSATYSGTTTVAGGTLILESANALGTGGLTLSGGTLKLDTDLANAITVAADTAVYSLNATRTLSGTISGSAAITVGTSLTLSGASDSFAGSILLSGTALNLTGSASLASAYVAGDLSGGTLDISGISGSSTRIGLLGGIIDFIHLGSKTLEVVVGGSVSSQQIDGSGGLTVLGQLVIQDAAATYGGVTTIADGASLGLQYGASIAGSSLIDVKDGGTFAISAASSGRTINDLEGEGARASVLLGSNTLTIANAASTFAGVIDGTGGVTVSTGTLTLSGANTYTGVTTIANGATVALTGNGSLAGRVSTSSTGTLDITGVTTGGGIGDLSGSGSVLLGSNTLTIGNASSTFSGTITGTGGLTLLGGTLSLTHDNSTTYSGTTTVAGGTLGATAAALGTGTIVLAGGTLSTLGTIANAITVTADSTLSGTASALNLSGSLSGDHVLTLQTSNAVRLTGGGSFSGTLDAQAGSGTTIEASYANAILQTSSTQYATISDGVTLASLSGDGIDYLNGTLTLSNASTTFGGAIFDNSATPSNLIIAGGTQTLSAGNAYTGATTIDHGATLALTSHGDISVSSGVEDNGTFDISGMSVGSATIVTLSGSGTVTLGNRELALSNASTTFTGVIGGAGSVAIEAGTQVFTGASTFTGETTISDGATLELANGASVGGEVDTSTTGILNITGTTGASVGAIAGHGSVNLDGTVLHLTHASSAQFFGTISGTGSLQLDDGTQLLASANTYSGGTTIAGGILAASAVGAFGSGALTLSGGTLGVGANIANAITVTADSGIEADATATLSGGISGDHVLTFTGSGNTLTLSTGGSFSGTFSNHINDFGTNHLVLQASYAQATLETVSGSTSEIASALSLKTISGDGTLTLDDTLTLTNASGDFYGTATGTGGLTITAGTLTMHNGGDYHGVTEIDDGATLVMTGGPTLSNSRIVLKQGGVLDISSATGIFNVNDLSGEAGSQITGLSQLKIRNAASTFAGAISGNGVLYIDSGTETLTGANTFTGAVEVGSSATLALTGSVVAQVNVSGGGTLDVSSATAASAGSLSTYGTIATGTSGVLTIAGSSTIYGAVQGAGTLKQAAGMLSITGDITGFTGALDVQDGASLQVAGLTPDATVMLEGSGSLSIAGGDRALASLSGDSASTVSLGAHNLTLNNAGGTFAGVIDGTGGLTIAGGTETLSGVNTYTGPTVVNSGATLAFAGSGSIASAIELDGTLDISGTTTGTTLGGIYGGGPVVLGSKTLTFNVTNDWEYTGSITGTGGLIVTGDSNGVQEFTQQLAYTGGTTLNGGGITLHSGGALAAGSDLVLNGGTFYDYATTAQTLGTVSGSGAANVTLNGIGGGSLSVASWTQTGGNMQLTNGMQLTIGALSGSTAMNIATGTGLIAGDASDTVFSGFISGSGDLTKQGTGTLTFGGNNGGFTGTVIVSAGTLAAGSDTALSTVNTIAVDTGATLDLNGHIVFPAQLTGTGTVTDSVGGGTLNIGASQTLDVTFTGAAGLTVSGGDVVLTGASAFTGQLVISNGSSVTLGANATIAGAAVVTNGTLDLTGIAASGASVGSLGGNGTVDATGQALTIDGSGTTTFYGTLNAASLTLGGSAIQTLLGTANLTGPVTIGSGAYLALGGSASLAGVEVTDNGTFDITGVTASSTSIASLRGSGNVYLADKTLVITDGNGTFTGDIYGTTGVVDISGTNQVLAGNNSYGGTTLLRPGTLLIVGSTTAFGTSVLDFQQGAALKFGALSGTFTNKAVLEGDASFHLAGGTVTYAGAVTGAGTLTVIGTGSTVVLTNAANDYGGTLVQSNSTVRVDVAGALGKGAVTLGADGFRGTLQAGASIALPNAITVKAGGGTIDTQGFDLTVVTIDGTGALTKAGSGTLILTGADTAATTIAAGTLKVGNGGAIVGNIADNGALVFDSTTTYAGTISGSGSLGVTGGTLTLTGSAAQTGGTTIASGATLQLNTGGSVAGAITDNGTLAFNGSTVWNNAVSGSGGVSITSGTVQLGTGSIAATNSLAVSNGATFDLNGRNQTISILSGTGAVALGSGTLTLNGGSFGGAIGGSGGLTTGGNVTLSGTSTYTGATKVNAGTLTVTGSIAGSAVTVASGATLAAGGAVSSLTIQSGGTLAPVAGSVGTLAVSGDLVLASGSSTAVDVTATSADKVTVGGAASIAGALNVSFLGTGFDVSQYTLISSAGALSGSFDSLNLNGTLGNLAATLVYDAHDVYLKLANTFVAGQVFSLDTGTANVNGDQTVGGLSGSGGTINTSGGTFTINQPGNSTFFGTITGSGPITKTGAGTLILDGNSGGFTGATTVNGGVFEIGDAAHLGAVYGGSITVGAGGTLGGHGTITGSVVNSGTTAPGGSIGTLTVLGNYNFASGAILQQEVAANGSADLLKVGGTVSIANNTTVQVLATDPVASYARVTNYTIVTGAGGVSGSFTNATSNVSQLTPILSYGPGAVNLTLVRNDISLATLANTANQAAVGGAISATPSSGLFATVAPLANAQLPAVFDSLSGEVHATLAGVLLNDGRVLEDAIRARGAAGEGTYIWGNGEHRSGSFDAGASTAAAGTHLSSFAAGADTAVIDGLRLGVAGGVARNTLSISARSSRGDVNSLFLGGYGSFTIGAYGFDAALTHGWNNIGTRRAASTGAASQAETADYNAGTTTLSGEARYRAGIGSGLMAEPFARLSMVWLSTDGFAETGGSAALSGTARDHNLLFSDVGARISAQYDLGDTVLSPHASLAWEHAAGDVSVQQGLAFAGGPVFNVAGAPIARDAAAIEAGLGLAIGNWTLGLDYTGRAGNSANENGVRVRIGTTF